LNNDELYKDQIDDIKPVKMSRLILIIGSNKLLQ